MSVTGGDRLGQAALARGMAAADAAVAARAGRLATAIERAAAGFGLAPVVSVEADGAVGLVRARLPGIVALEYGGRRSPALGFVRAAIEEGGGR